MTSNKRLDGVGIFMISCSSRFEWKGEGVEMRRVVVVVANLDKTRL